MRLFPRSLAGQMLLLVVGALLVAQSIHLALLLNEVRGRRATFVEGGAIARTMDTVERVQNGLPVGRLTARGPDRLTVVVGSTPAIMNERDRPLEQRIASAMSTGGYGIGEVRASRAEDKEGRERLLVSVRLADRRWVNLASYLPPGDAALVSRLVGQTVLLFLALLVAVVAIGRHVARPLRSISRAAESFGRSGRVEMVTAGGPDDVQQLIAAFNQMQARILEMLSEKDRMLGAIGHDLRTPLASLRLRVESVDDPAERERMVSTIEEMSRTLEDILSLARLGRSAEDPVRVDLTSLVEALVDDLSALGMPVHFSDGQRLLARVRPGLLRRALRNLIENAVNYGNAANVRIQASGQSIIISIDDQGEGIPEDDLERVMDGFVRLDESRNRATGGSGLGLTIARSIIHENGGTLDLANLPQRGLRATVRLPLDR